MWCTDEGFLYAQSSLIYTITCILPSFHLHTLQTNTLVMSSVIFKLPPGGRSELETLNLTTLNIFQKGLCQ